MILAQKTLKVCLAAAAVVLVVAGCGSKGDATDTTAPAGTLKLGASISLTGSLAREGILTQEGYDVCVNVVNAKGGVSVGGQKLKLEIAYQDDTSKPDTAGQLIDQFNDQGIKLILGPYGSATTGAAAAVVERNGQLMADSSGADDAIFTKGYKRTFAVLSPATSYASSILTAINELASPKPKTVAFISADDGFSKTATTGATAKAQELGLTVVGTEFVPNGASDVSSALTKIKGKNPDVIIGSVHLAEGVAIIKQSVELGVKPPGGFGETVAPPTPDFVQTLGRAAEGVLGSTQWTVKTQGSDAWFGSANDYNKTFAANFGGRDAEYHGAEATAACLALVLAVQKAGSTDVNKVRDAMAALDEQSFFGPLKFSPTGQNLTKSMGVIQIQNGKPLQVWPKSGAEAPLKWPGAA
jgi:branched-chain amino acid transport system substrate-binding protein